MTVGEWLEKLATSNTSEEKDWRVMQKVLRAKGFGSAVVVYGVVYLEGRGTIGSPPAGINLVAKELLAITRKVKV